MNTIRAPLLMGDCSNFNTHLLCFFFRHILQEKQRIFTVFVDKLALEGCFITDRMSLSLTQMTGQNFFIAISTKSCIDSSLVLVQGRSVAIYWLFVVDALDFLFN